MTPTREEIVKLLRRAAVDASGWMEEPLATAEARVFTEAADALEAAPTLTFEERVARAAPTLWKIRAADLCDLLLEEKLPWTDAPLTMASIIRRQTVMVLRAAGVEE